MRLFKIYFKNFQVLPYRITRENRIALREILLLIFIATCIQGIYNYTTETTNVSRLFISKLLLLLLLLLWRVLNILISPYP